MAELGEGDISNGEPPSEDTMKILVATDIHLGYKEKDPIRGQDTFITLEEILKQAQQNKVDFVLLGGDLFHENRPSPHCIQQCLELLRKYCLNDKPVGIEYLSDQSYDFQFQRIPIVNYEDPNLNVGIPVFSIHGNHDDPAGHKQTSALDVLASTGLLNYFGRWNDLSKVVIRPILLQKGCTKLALYGLSHIKDERLGRLFREKKVHLKVPDSGDWFHMLVLHQNRAARGVKNFIPETALPDTMNLVIWGHEHDCRIEPEETANGLFISQPGSSVATSLATGESIPKKIGLLKIYKDKFTILPIPLKTVRPFLIDELILERPLSDAYHSEKPSEQAINQVKAKIEEMIKQANSQYTDKPTLPLLRLKVFYHNEQQQFNSVRVGMHFGGRVANPEDVIKLNSLTAKERKQKCTLNLDEDDYERFVNVSEWATSVEDVVMKYFENPQHKEAMSVLSVKALNEAVTRYVKYQDVEAFNVVDKEYKNTVAQLTAMDPDVYGIDDALETIRQQREQDGGEPSVQRDGGKTEVLTPSNETNNDGLIVLSDDDDDLSANFSANKKNATPKPKGNGRGRGRGSARGTQGKRGRGQSSYNTLDSFYK